VWHASLAHHGRRPVADDADYLTRCERALQGVGDPLLGEWLHRGARAWHLRRRLSAVEVAASGLVMRDVRGTPEVEARLAPVRHLLPPGFHE
jgi:hypothetical protein